MYWFQHEPCWFVRKTNAPWYGKPRRIPRFGLRRRRSSSWVDRTSDDGRSFDQVAGERRKHAGRIALPRGDCAGRVRHTGRPSGPRGVGLALADWAAELRGWCSASQRREAEAEFQPWARHWGGWPPLANRGPDGATWANSRATVPFCWPGSSTGGSESIVNTSTQPGEPFNAYRMFTGLFIPEGLACCPRISAGAKLTWGRLVRYAGHGRSLRPHDEEPLARDRRVRAAGSEVRRRVGGGHVGPPSSRDSSEVTGRSRHLVAENDYVRGVGLTFRDVSVDSSIEETARRNHKAQKPDMARTLKRSNQLRTSLRISNPSGFSILRSSTMRSRGPSAPNTSRPSHRIARSKPPYGCAGVTLPFAPQ